MLCFMVVLFKTYVYLTELSDGVWRHVADETQKFLEMERGQPQKRTCEAGCLFTE